MSDPLPKKDGAAVGDNANSLPPPQSFDWIDKIIIVCLIGIFLFLFIWFSITRDQPLFAFWTFNALLTLIFVGVLRATGIIRTSWMALGGSVAVYAALIWLTEKPFDRYHDNASKIRELESQIAALQNRDPAKVALQQYFGFLQQKNFAEAYEIVSDARKQERKMSLPPGADDFLVFKSTFEGTRGYRDFTYEFDKAIGEDRGYRVEYDVRDEIPRSVIFEHRTQKLSSFDGALTREKLAKLAIDNLKEYYVVPDEAISAIERYLGSRTIDDLMDPVFIATTVNHIRVHEKLELQKNSPEPTHSEVWRHFKHDILMTKERGLWKIRSGLNNPVVSIYR